MYTRDSSRRTRIAALVVGLVLVLDMAPVSAATRTTNVANLDDGTCGRNLQIGSDKTASSTANPSFLLWGDGGLSSYAAFIDGTPIGTFYSDGFANVCIHAPNALSDGQHVLTGNELAPHNTYTITPFNFSIDTVLPATPSRPVLSGYSDSGIPGDGTTRFRGVNFTGTSDPGVSIQLYSGVSGIGGARADTDGRWSATTTQLADGTYTVAAAAFDGAGNKSAPSTSMSVTIDAAVPAAPPAPTLDPTSDTSPVGDNATTVTAPRVVGTGAPGMWKVTVFVDGAQVGVTTPDASGTWSFTLPTLAIATHLVTAKLTDMADNQGGASAALNLAISDAPPGVAPSVPGAPTLTSATAGSGQVALTWTAPASNGGAAIAYYTVTASPGGASCTAGTLGCTVGGLANGTTYTFTVTASNVAGTGPASTSLQATPAAPAIAPIVIPPTAAVAALAYWRSSTSIGLAWSATPGSAAVTSYDVRYRRAPWNGSFGSPVTWLAGTGATGATFGGAAGSTYCFSVRANDALGSVSAWTPETCTVVPLDDRSLSRYGAWTSGTGTTYYKSTYRRSYTSGARLVRASVVGRRIAIVATTCRTCGKVRVYWGSTLMTTVNLYSSTTVNRKVIPVITFTGPRTGTVTVRAYGSSKVVMDGIAIGRN